jgi:hypothetical protein
MREAGTNATTLVPSIYLPEYHYQTSYDEISWDEFFKMLEEEAIPSPNRR